MKLLPDWSEDGAKSRVYDKVMSGDAVVTIYAMMYETRTSSRPLAVFGERNIQSLSVSYGSGGGFSVGDTSSPVLTMTVLTNSLPGGSSEAVNGRIVDVFIDIEVDDDYKGLNRMYIGSFKCSNETSNSGLFTTFKGYEALYDEFDYIVEDEVANEIVYALDDDFMEKILQHRPYAYYPAMGITNQELQAIGVYPDRPAFPKGFLTGSCRNMMSKGLSSIGMSVNPTKDRSRYVTAYPKDVGITFTPSHYYGGDFIVGDNASVTISHVSATIKSGDSDTDEYVYNPDSYDGAAIHYDLSNVDPDEAKAFLADVYKVIKYRYGDLFPLTYRAFSVTVNDGFWMEPFDVFKVVDIDGTEYDLMATDVTVNYDGAFKTTISASVPSTLGESNSIDVSSSWVDANNAVATKDYVDSKVGSINAFDLNQSPSIPENADLNDYDTPGTYYVSSGNRWGTLANRPEDWPNGSAKYVFVKQISSAIFTQQVVDSANGRTYIRRKSSGVWQAWYAPSGSCSIIEAGTTTDGWTYRKYSDGSCVADYYETGTYSFSNSTIVSGLKAHTVTNLKLPFNMRRVTAQGGTAGSFPSFVAIRGTGAGSDTLSGSITAVWYALTTSTSTTAIRISVSGYWQ